MLSVYMAVRVRPFPKLPPLGAERVRSLDPDIARVERESIAAFDAVPLEGLQEELRHPVARKPRRFALPSTQALPTMSAYDAAWI
jgi:hypothetical protein